MARKRIRTGPYFDWYEWHQKQLEKLRGEVGGTLDDIQKYLFSLDKRQLSIVLNDYENLIKETEENKNTKSARQYAEKTLEEWKSGKKMMSGKVAERFLKVIPLSMPLTKKYDLVTSLWNHSNQERTKKIIYFGKNCKEIDIVRFINKYFSDIIDDFRIPKNLENRFNWLSSNDVLIKQQLLNNFTKTYKEEILIGLESKLKFLNNKLRKNNIKELQVNISIKNHEVQLVYDKFAKEITEIKPDNPYDKVIYLFLFNPLFWVFIYILYKSFSN